MRSLVNCHKIRKEKGKTDVRRKTLNHLGTLGPAVGRASSTFTLSPSSGSETRLEPTQR
jgi:hypothetical protein